MLLIILHAHTRTQHRRFFQHINTDSCISGSIFMNVTHRACRSYGNTYTTVSFQQYIKGCVRNVQCIWKESAAWYVYLQRWRETLSSAYCPRCISERQNFMMHDFARPGSGCSQLIMEAQTAGLINSEGSTRWTCKSFFSLESSWVWALGFLGPRASSAAQPSSARSHD